MTTKDTDDRPVLEQLPAGGETVNKDISSQRRKIIKASAAVVPAIMTIRSGAAAAAMTSLHACVDKDADRSAAANVVYEAPDEWVRVAGLQIKSGNDDLFSVPTNGFVSETDNGGIDDYTAWYDSNGGTDKVAGNSAPTPYIDGVTPQEIGRGIRVWLLVHVDIDPLNNENNEYFWYPKDATLMSDQMTMDGSQITASCMCSVDPNFTKVAP